MLPKWMNMFHQKRHKLTNETDKDKADPVLAVLDAIKSANL
jgi:hypothetical protein